MNQKHLEIYLSQHVEGFIAPKVELEQYITPPGVAASFIHFAANNGHVQGKQVVDLGAGTGMLGIAAATLGAEVTFVEKDADAFVILKRNLQQLKVRVPKTSTTAIQQDVFSFEPETSFDTVLLNPPFGIQQKFARDVDFVEKAASIGRHIYSIHDGSPANISQLPKILKTRNLDPQGYYTDEFQLQKSYEWHDKESKPQQVMIIYSVSEFFK